jgi:hypothetical protein
MCARRAREPHLHRGAGHDHWQEPRPDAPFL